jgi:hypothetical protein
MEFIVMHDMTDRKEIGGGTIHLADCYVWAEIHYLDSPTDYREYMSNHVSQPSAASGDEFITLDNAGRFPWRRVAQFLAGTLYSKDGSPTQSSIRR